MTVKTRLEKLDNHLTVKQYMLLMIEEMQHYDSFDDYSIHHVIGKWNRLTNDFNKVTEGIRAKLKGEDKGKVERAVNKASKEGSFLYLLLGRVITSFQNERYRHAYNGLLLVNFWQKAQNISLQQLALQDKSQADLQEATEEIKEVLNLFKTRSIRHLYHLLTERRLVEEISNRYFDGRELMFKQDRENLEAMTRQALGMIEHAKELVTEVAFLHDENMAGKPLIDVDAIRTEVEQDLEQHVQYEIDMAKAEIFSQIGKLDKGHAIYAQYGKMIAGGNMRGR